MYAQQIFAPQDFTKKTKISQEDYCINSKNLLISSTKLTVLFKPPTDKILL